MSDSSVAFLLAVSGAPSATNMLLFTFVYLSLNLNDMIKSNLLLVESVLGIKAMKWRIAFSYQKNKLRRTLKVDCVQ